MFIYFNFVFFLGADLIYNALKLVNIDVLRTGDLVKQFFDEKIKEKLQVLCSAVVQKSLTKEQSKSDVLSIDKTEFSTRDQDPEWFSGMPSFFYTCLST